MDLINTRDPETGGSLNYPGESNIIVRVLTDVEGLKSSTHPTP